MLTFILGLTGGEISLVAPQEPQTYTTQAIATNESYSWWCKPISIYDPVQDCNYFGSIGPAGEHVLTRVQGAQVTRLVLHTGIGKDEHNTPSFLIRENDILCSYTGHNDARTYVQTVAKDLSVSYSKSDIAVQIGFTQASYTQLYYVANRYFIFTRNASYTWRVTWSDDAITWQPSVIFATKAQANPMLYLGGMRTSGSVINFGAYYHPEQSGSGPAGNKLVMLQFNALSGDITSKGQLLGNLYNPAYVPVHIGNLSADYTTYAAATGWRFRYLDLAGDASIAHLLIADFAGSRTTQYAEGSYRYVKVNLATNTILENIEIVGHGTDTYISYFGGAYFVQSETGQWNNEITLCRESNGTWYTEIWKYANGAITKQAEIEALETTAAGLSLTRPQPPLNAALGGLKMLYQKGDYDEGYKTWNNEVIAVKTQNT